ncbi:MAG: type II secretion system protein GspC [Aquificota bacterium]|nr:type II secretion system protein GspC [Aquificota bacterium]
MNWALLSLPLVISLSLVLAVALPPFLLERTTRWLHVPERTGGSKDITPVLEAFSRVFGEPAGEVRRETPKDLVLVGTSTGVKKMALILKDGKPLILEEGEEKEGVLLKEVRKREVKVRSGGRELTLRIRKFVPGEVRRTGTVAQEFRISRRDLERITRDPGVMFREIRLVPYVKDGRTKGFIFEWVKPGSLFHRAGIRRGDVLVSINNVAINSAEDAFRVLQLLRNEPSLRVVILRGGQRKELNIRIE